MTYAITNLPGGLAVPNTGDDMQDLATFIGSFGLKFFKPYEFMVMGSDHASPNRKGYGKNGLPPRNLWPNIWPTAQVLDLLRSQLSHPIVTLSVFRTPAYNGAVGGKPASLHMKFNAIDFTAKGLGSPTDWGNILAGMRASGIFAGGIGVYPGFIHVDTRGKNTDWA